MLENGSVGSRCWIEIPVDGLLPSFLLGLWRLVVLLSQMSTGCMGIDLNHDLWFLDRLPLRYGF